MQELKIKIADVQAAEEKLRNAGATFVEELSFTDTYFKQPPGDVFKVSDTGKGYFLVQLKKTTDGKFDCLKNYQIDNSAQVISEMTGEYGIKSVLKGKRRIFSLGDMQVTISTIDTLGSFLIVTAENPTPEIITSKLSIQNPEFIQVSFDELPATTPAAASPSPQQ